MAINLNLKVNALDDLIIRIYLHKFTNNEWKISIPHEVAEGLKKDKCVASTNKQARDAKQTSLILHIDTLEVSRSHFRRFSENFC